MLNHRIGPVQFALLASVVVSALFPAQSSKGPTAVDSVVHTCLIPRTSGARATGQLYTSNVIWGDSVIWGSNLQAVGACQGASSWSWIERIATTAAVTPTPPQASGVAQVVDSIRGVGRVRPQPVSAAEFQRSVDAASPIVVRDFVFPRGVFPQEAQMLARGAAQPSGCPAGAIYMPAPSAPAPCVPAPQVTARFLGSLIKKAGSSIQ